MLALWSPTPADSPSVRAVPERSRCLVGETVVITIRVEPGGDGLVLVPPKLAEVDGGLTPAGGPGRFTVTPRRAGTLVVSPFRLKRGDAVVASSGPLRLTVAPVPSEGRPAWFLGGVGSFAVAASASAERVRVGASLRYQLELTGPAAPGSTQSPDLRGWSSRIPGLQVGLPETEIVPGEQPTKRFRFPIRPTRVGRFVLPPVAVAAFDPTTRRYVTRTTAGIPVEVEPAQSLETAVVVAVDESASPIRTDPRVWGLRHRIAIVVGFGTVVLIALGLIGRRRRRLQQADPRAFARELAAQLDPTADRDQAARAISLGLAEYLRRTTDRPPGELTPRELAEALRDDDPDLATEAERLLEATDQARFGPVGEDDARSLVEQARRVLTRLANSPRKGVSRRDVRAGTDDQPRE